MLKFAKEGQIILGDFAKQQLTVEWKYEYTQILPISTGWVYEDWITIFIFLIYW
jgi:hypothetical protein